MAGKRTLKSRKPPAVLERATRLTRDDGSNPYAAPDAPNPTEKDKTELELEKLVFGDEAGFREGLKSYKDNAEGASSPELSQIDEVEGAVEDEDTDVEALNDDDLFFFDTGAPTSNIQDLIQWEEEPSEQGDPPAWIDSDDERIFVSLASQPRLRKLRVNESEDVISGKEYVKRLRQQFERLHPVPEWAKSSSAGNASHRRKRRRTSGSDSSASGTDVDDAPSHLDGLSAQPLAQLLQSAAPLTQESDLTSTHRKLRPETIDIQRTKDVGGTQPSAILSLSFHPTSPLLLSSGPAALLSLHHISPSAPSPNPLLTSIAVPSLPLSTSAIHPSGTRIFFSGRRRYFHIWDLSNGRISPVTRIYGHAEEQRTCERFRLSPCGRWMGLVGSARKGGGIVNVLDANTSQWICQARVEGRGGVADFAWWQDGEGLVVIGKSGEAIEYSMHERRVVAKWSDEGAVGTTVIALGGVLPAGQVSKNALGGDRWVAVGSQSGIVNVYDRSMWSATALPERPKPKRVLQQLVTPTSHLLFSPDGQLLIMSSRWKRDSLRLVHLPTCTVYKNWPTSNTPFGRITAVAISANSKMLAVGNEQGKIRLWEVRS